jgi:hypothetical protein
VLKLNISDTEIEACYLVLTAELARAKRSRIGITDRLFVEACRYETLDAFCGMCVGLEERPAA